MVVTNEQFSADPERLRVGSCGGKGRPSRGREDREPWARAGPGTLRRQA